MCYNKCANVWIYSIDGVWYSVKKIRFSAEILCLFFIICLTILFGKILYDVKNVINLKINQLIPQKQIVVEYQAFSYNLQNVINDIDELNIVKSEEDLNLFNKKLNEKNVNIKWLSNKLYIYDKDFFKDKTLIVLFIENDDNITITRINSVLKKNNNITIGVTKKQKDYDSNNKYTWLAILEISDRNSKILVDISKV